MHLLEDLVAHDGQDALVRVRLRLRARVRVWVGVRVRARVRANPNPDPNPKPNLVRAIADEGVALARARLAVREHRAVVARHHILEHRRAEVVVDRLLARVVGAVLGAALGLGIVARLVGLEPVVRPVAEVEGEVPLLLRLGVDESGHCALHPYDALGAGRLLAGAERAHAHRDLDRLDLGHAAP